VKGGLHGVALVFLLCTRCSGDVVDAAQTRYLFVASLDALGV
jgi:hypothetical protein